PYLFFVYTTRERTVAIVSIADHQCFQPLEVRLRLDLVETAPQKKWCGWREEPCRENGAATSIEPATSGMCFNSDVSVKGFNRSRGRLALNHHGARCALFPLIRLQDLFAQAQGFGGDFHELVVGDEFNCLLKVQLTERN